MFKRVTWALFLTFHHLIVLIKVIVNKFPWLNSLAAVSERIERLENIVGHA